MQQPSRKWKSQKLAVLESMDNWLQKRLLLCSVLHAGALGFFVHWWLSENHSTSFSIASRLEPLVTLSFFFLVFFGLVGIVLAYFMMELRKRMER